MAWTKTGEVYFRDEQGALVLAESFEDEIGQVRTENTIVEPADEAPATDPAD